jgi:hypothetical protein
MVHSFRANLTLFLSVALLVSPAFASHIHRAPTAGQSRHSHRLAGTSRRASAHDASTDDSSTRSSSGRGSSRRAQASRPAPRSRGQQAIAPERVTEIQQALIREHYMTGEPNGQWDSTTISAIQKYQADQGWQTKLMPDSRAIKKLGLGPDYSGAINAKSNSSFLDPPPVSTIPTNQAAGFTEASGVKQ